jgi:hypothetical protein
MRGRCTRRHGARLAERGRLGAGAGTERGREGDAVQRRALLVHLEVEREGVPVAAKMSVAGGEVVLREGAVPAGTHE